MAPHAYVTYYQAQGLSGHTSPCGECAYFIDPYALTVHQNYYCPRVTYISFQKYKWAHLIRKEIFFLFSLEHHAFFGHNTWCSGTSCGGINPYTLTAKLRPAWIDGSGPSERRRAAQPTYSESRAMNQDRFGD